MSKRKLPPRKTNVKIYKNPTFDLFFINSGSMCTCVFITDSKLITDSVQQFIYEQTKDFPYIEYTSAEFTNYMLELGINYVQGTLF